MSQFHDARPSGIATGATTAATTYGPPVPRKPRTKTERRTFLDRVVTNVHSGVYNEADGAKVLKLAGFPDSHNPFVSENQTIGHYAHKVASNPTLFHLVDFSGSDQRRQREAQEAAWKQAHPEWMKNDPVLRAVGTPEDIHRVGLVVPTGGGIVGQTIAQYAAATVNTPGGVAAALLHPVGTAQRIAEHLSHPNVVEDALLGYLALHAGAAGVLRGRAFAGVVRGGEGAVKGITVRPGAHPFAPDVTVTRQSPLRTATTRSAIEGGGLLHTPYATPVPITIPGQRLQGPATAAGVVPRAPGLTIERPVIQNPLIRPFSRARSNRIQRVVSRETPERAAGIPFGRTHNKLRGTFGAHATAGREIRARIRVEQEIENAHAHELARVTSKLTPKERDALTVVAISGDEALTNPAAAIAQQTARHQHFIAIGGDAARNTEHIKGLQNARAVLEDPSPKFLRAVMQAREVSNQTEARLVAADHLEAGAAAGRQAKIADIYGYPAPPPGSFYFPLSERYMNEGIIPAGPGGAKPSMYGTSPPSASARVPGLKQEFTGGQLVRGRLPDIGGATAKRSQQVSNLLAVERQFDDLFRVGRAERRSEFDIPIRATAEVKGDLRRFISDLTQRADREGVDPNDLITAGDLQNLRDLIDASAQYGNRAVGPGSRVDGIRWVDSRLIAPMGPSVKGKLFSAADAVTNPIRVTQLYARPAYILNLAGNVGMNGISDGARVFPALKWAVQAQRRTPENVMREIDGGMGISLSRSYSVGRGVGGQLSDKMAEFWNRITDMHSRRAAFKAAAAREGFTTDAQIVDLMTNPANAAAKLRVFRQGNKNIVDYSSLSPFERDEVRRLIYFYPWVSRGTVWALRTMVEHPYKTFTLFELGQIGAENAHRKLGAHQPNWVEELGLVPLGSKGDRTKVINPSSVWTPTTAVQAFSAGIDTAKAALGLPHTAAGFGDLATPAAELLIQAGTKYEGGPTASGLMGQLESLPFYQAGRRGGLYGSASKTYPERGLGPALGPLGGGGFFPRGVSRGALGDQAVKQETTPKGKLAVQLDRLVEAGLATQERADTAKAALDKATPKDITAARTQVGAVLRVADDIGRLEANGKISSDQAAAMKAGLLGASPTQIEEAARTLKQAVGG